MHFLDDVQRSALIGRSLWLPRSTHSHDSNFVSFSYTEIHVSSPEIIVSKNLGSLRTDSKFSSEMCFLWHAWFSVKMCGTNFRATFDRFKSLCSTRWHDDLESPTSRLIWFRVLRLSSSTATITCWSFCCLVLGRPDRGLSTVDSSPDWNRLNHIFTWV